jgi:hypothetical protein
MMFRYRFRAFLPGRVPRGCSLPIDLARLFEKQNRQLNVIFDIGANVGQTAKWLGNVFPEAFIHSFEPVVGTFDRLCANVRNLKRVTPHNLAIGATSGKIRMDLLKIDAEGHEIHVLNGARELFERGKIASVYAEVDFAPDGAHGDFFELHEFLASHQFNFYALYDYSSWKSAPAHAFCNGLWVHSSLWS